MAAPVRRRGAAARAACCAAFLAVCALPAVLAGGAIGWMPLLLALALLPVSAAYLGLVARRVELEPDAAPRVCVRGQRGGVGVAVRNASPLVAFRVEPTFVVEGGDGGPQTLRMRAALGPRAVHRFDLGATFDHVGTYRVGVAAVETYDLLGLFSSLRRTDAHGTVRCVPRVRPLDGLPGSELTTSDAPRSVRTVLSDDMDYAFVREYQLGDPMKTVHWKMSARGDDRLYTKLFESHTNPGTTLVLDFRSTEPDAERRACMYDTLLESAFSIVAHARAVGIRTTLAFVDRRGEARLTSENDPDRLNALVDDMPRLGDSMPAGTVTDLLDAESRDPDAETNLLLLSCDPARETVQALVRRRGLHRPVSVLRVVAPGAAGAGGGAGPARSDAALVMLAQAQVPVVTVSDADELAGAMRP